MYVFSALQLKNECWCLLWEIFLSCIEIPFFWKSEACAFVFIQNSISKNLWWYAFIRFLLFKKNLSKVLALSIKHASIHPYFPSNEVKAIKVYAKLRIRLIERRIISDAKLILIPNPTGASLTLKLCRSFIFWGDNLV